MAKKYTNYLQFVLFFVFSLFLSNAIYAQCAGNDANLSVCDIPNPSSQSINLFNLLGAGATAGGTWTDDSNTGGLNLTTGVLNAQIIPYSGVYKYTYTVTGVAGCTDNSSTVTVTIGGYSGVASPNVSVCSADETFNLFQAFNGVSLGPQFNGQWHNDTTNQNIGALIAVSTLQGTYQYTYTIPAIGSCPAVSSVAYVTVIRAPESGVSSNLYLCATDGLSGYNNFDLNTLLAGEDMNGTWIDSNNTGQITSTDDHFIDIEKIYNTKGAGEFFFSYTVVSTNPICQNDVSTLKIVLEKKLDLTGAKIVVNSDICETDIATASYSATITKGPAPILNGSYYVIYNVSGPNTGNETIVASFSNGVLIFPIQSSYFQQAGTFKVTILNIFPINSNRVCSDAVDGLSDDLNIYKLPDLTNAKIKPITTCQNKSALVEITGATNILDGIYDLNYSISGANTINGQVGRATFTGGMASFPYPAFLNNNSGIGVITINNITHVGTQCTNTANLKGDIFINPLPNSATLKVQVADVCFGSPVTALVSGLANLTDVTLSYTLLGSNIATVQTIVLAPVNGNANFVIPSGLLLNTGATTISVTNLQNNTTTCDVDITGLSDDFLINPIPAAPTSVDQSFCKIDNATVANLEPKGDQYKWYDSATATLPLESTAFLITGTYYIKEVPSTGCISASTVIKVTINDEPVPVLNPGASDFCGLDNPTISNLSDKTDSPSTVAWYDAPNNGNLLPSATLLINKMKYYGFNFTETTNCLSSAYVEVTVSLTNCSEPDTFFIPDGFSPNGDGVNDSFVITDIDFVYPDYRLQIFNRYGNEMYKGFKNKPGWDGKNYETSGIAGGIAPNGVYYYILYFNKDNKPPKQGYLYLNR